MGYYDDNEEDTSVYESTDRTGDIAATAAGILLAGFGVFGAIVGGVIAAAVILPDLVEGTKDFVSDKSNWYPEEESEEE